MTIAETENFYNSDEILYVLKENKEFMDLYKAKTKDGFRPAIDIDQMQKLIYDIVRFFEFKYPIKLIDQIIFHTKRNDIGDIKNYVRISKSLDMNQLRYRIGHYENLFLDCPYGGYIYINREKNIYGNHLAVVLE